MNLRFNPVIGIIYFSTPGITPRELIVALQFQSRLRDYLFFYDRDSRPTVRLSIELAAASFQSRLRDYLFFYIRVDLKPELVAIP